MINSRKLEDLDPFVATLARQFLAACKEAGIDVTVTSTYRDNESQTALYAQGRTAPGKIVTNAKAGYSAHNFKCAFDVVPTRNGVAVWGTSGEDGKLWARIGKIGQECGLEWGGAWTSFKDMPHFQYTGGHTLAQLRAGAKLVA